MFNLRELASIGILSLIFGVIFGFNEPLEVLSYFILASFLIIMSNSIAKKIASYYLDSEIEIKFWEIRRYGFKPHKHFKNGFPMGIILPLITAVASLGYFTWMASLIFEVKPKIYRAAKRFGLYSFSEMTENHIGLIAAAGVVVNLVLAAAGYLAGFEEFSRLNIYFSFFNMIPLSDLDGNKIFFGSFVLWSLLAALVLLGMGYIFFVV